MTNEIASKSLSKSQNEIDMKKVYINAQVKAMISVIESLSNIVLMVVLYFVVRTSFTTLIIPVIVYMIIIPITFLMNTFFSE